MHKEFYYPTFCYLKIKFPSKTEVRGKTHWDCTHLLRSHSRSLMCIRKTEVQGLTNGSACSRNPFIFSFHLQWRLPKSKCLNVITQQFSLYSPVHERRGRHSVIHDEILTLLLSNKVSGLELPIIQHRPPFSQHIRDLAMMRSLKFKWKVQLNSFFFDQCLLLYQLKIIQNLASNSVISLHLNTK